MRSTYKRVETRSKKKKKGRHGFKAIRPRYKTIELRYEEIKPTYKIMTFSEYFYYF